MTHVKQNLTPTRDAGLVALAIYKFVKSVTLLSLGLAAFRLVNPDTADHLADWLLHVNLSTGRELVDRVVGMLDTLTSRHAMMFGSGAILYGLLFGVEGVGLWKAKRWAEYLVVVTTGLLIPVEIYELTRRLTSVRITALVINLLAVGYLVYRLRHPRPEPVRVLAHSQERARG
jgi:uncharacterized membrane protein (DUF2068 family)